MGVPLGNPLRSIRPPKAGERSPYSSFKRLDFPEPFAPYTAQCSPLRICQFTLRNTERYSTYRWTFDRCTSAEVPAGAERARRRLLACAGLFGRRVSPARLLGGAGSDASARLTACTRPSASSRRRRVPRGTS